MGSTSPNGATRMHVTREICQSCGMTTEVVISRLSDSISRCGACRKPLHPPKVPSGVGAGLGGSLQLRSVPGRGLGVFSAKPIANGTLVERCPVFVFGRISDDIREIKMLPYSESGYSINLGHLLLPWVEDKDRAIALGYALLYNHEPKGRSNVRYEPYIDPENNRRYIDFYAKRDIEAGEELTQTYTDSNRLWFTYKPPVGGLGE